MRRCSTTGTRNDGRVAEIWSIDKCERRFGRHSKQWNFNHFAALRVIRHMEQRFGSSDLVAMKKGGGSERRVLLLYNESER